MENDNNFSDINKLYKHVEIKLEDIADKLLISKAHDKDSVLFNIQIIIENIFINAAMKRANNNISKAAQLLGINRNTLSKKLKESQSLNKNI
jgi:transcriptional regulator of acetoin/glycerol metabolism